MPIDFPAFGYAAAVAAGGVLGFVKSNSIPSLAAGLLFGSFLGYGAYQVSENPREYGFFLGTSTVLGGVMGYRYYNTRKIMPAGAIAVMSGVMIIRTLVNRFTAPPIEEVKIQ